MKSITLKSLKENLSQYTEEAAKGIPIEITKYNKPYVYIHAAASPSLHIGCRIGSPLRSIAKKASRNKFLKILKTDRQD